MRVISLAIAFVVVTCCCGISGAAAQLCPGIVGSRIAAAPVVTLPVTCRWTISCSDNDRNALLVVVRGRIAEGARRLGRALGQAMSRRGERRRIELFGA